MLSDSADPAWGLPPLGERYAADAFVYSNDIRNATPASGAVVGRTLHEGFLGRAVSLADFHRFGSRMWVHCTGHRLKLQSRALPGRFLGFERPLSSGIYRVLLDDGSITVSQSVQFSDVGFAATSPPPQVPAAGGGADDEDSSDDGDVANAPAVEPEQVTEESDDEVDLRHLRIPPSPPPPPAAPPLSALRRSVWSTRNANLNYTNALRPRTHAAAQIKGMQGPHSVRRCATRHVRSMEHVAAVANVDARVGVRPKTEVRPTREQTGELPDEQAEKAAQRRRRAPGSRRAQRLHARRRRRQAQAETHAAVRKARKARGPTCSFFDACIAAAR
jgi:hypothetical protein